jgi:hypothetical protein
VLGLKKRVCVQTLSVLCALQSFKKVLGLERQSVTRVLGLKEGAVEILSKDSTIVVTVAAGMLTLWGDRRIAFAGFLFARVKCH